MGSAPDVLIFLLRQVARLVDSESTSGGGTTAFLMLMAVTVLAGCIIAGPDDPYAYSPIYCAGCWYGRWAGTEGDNRAPTAALEQPWMKPEPSK